MKRVLSLLLSLALLLPLVSLQTWAAPEEGDSGLLWVVNYDHPIDSGYVPQGLQGTAGGLRPEAYTAFQQMMADMRAAGSSAYLASGYRSYNKQNELFLRRLNTNIASGLSHARAYAATRRYTAVPGTSEHQLGLAADITTDGTLTSRFANTGAGKWLTAHCAQYGFVLRYDGAKESLTQIAAEAWHFRYVGLPHSQIMAEKNWCLEEYIAALQESKLLTWEDGAGMLYRVSWYDSKPQTGSGYVIDCSQDNMGGWIVTECQPVDPLSQVGDHPAATALHHLFDRGGMPTVSLVEPDGPISRADFAALYAQLPLPQGEAPLVFSDVPETSPYRPALDKLGRAGVLSPSDDFVPEREMTRNEAAIFVARLLPDQEPSRLAYADLSAIPDWAFQSVQEVATYGLMGAGEGYFRPEEPLTWAEAATLLYALESLLYPAV